MIKPDILDTAGFPLKLSRRLAAVWHPEWYHEPGSRRPWFEGWYFKCVSRDRSRTVALIPGIFLNGGEEDHSFIQVLDNETNVRYITFPADAFRARTRPFSIEIANNRFSLTGISLNSDRDGVRITGVVTFGPGRPWPVRIFSPGAMGWYAFLPTMECYHGVLSMAHTLAGAVSIDDRKIDVSGGRGYMEKDWGRSFPSAYIWIQCNHFEREEGSIILSLARVPWRTGTFTGVLAGLSFGKQFHRFTTYTGCVIERCRLFGNKIEITLRRRNLVLDVSAVRAETGTLRGPGGASMHRRVAESLGSEVTVRLKKDGMVLFEERGFPAALETHGSIEELKC